MGKITRVEISESKFKYLHADGTEVRDAQILQWILDLRIPPKWHDVVIFYNSPGKQTCCGYDDRNRMQCLYNKAWLKKTRDKKYCDLIHFGSVLPSIQNDINAALATQRFTLNKVISLIVKIVTSCGFRLGTLTYEASNQSIGITTIRRSHVTFTRDSARIEFTGKKGVFNECVVTDPAVVNALRALHAVDKKDDHVMMYQAAGEWYHVKHTQVNAFLKQYGENITSKDFRTFQANETFIQLARSREDPTTLTVTARKRAVNEIVDTVSASIHNTRAICKKDYLDSDIWQMYIDQPRRFRTLFITPTTSSRVLFMNYLRKKCE